MGEVWYSFLLQCPDNYHAIKFQQILKVLKIIVIKIFIKTIKRLVSMYYNLGRFWAWF